LCNRQFMASWRVSIYSVWNALFPTSRGEFVGKAVNDIFLESWRTDRTNYVLLLQECSHTTHWFEEEQGNIEPLHNLMQHLSLEGNHNPTIGEGPALPTVAWG
jgi:hypothetical protein